MESTVARDFWRVFDAEASDLATKIAAGDLRGAFSRVESLLDAHGLGFCFELTQEGRDAVLVLTPEGDEDQARQIDAFVQLSPGIAGWRVYSRRQRKPLNDVYAFVRHIYDLDVTDATFDLRESPQGDVVTMHSKAVQGLTEEQAQGLVATFLDHAVGEGVVMASVGGMSATDGLGELSAEALVAALVRNRSDGEQG